MCYSEFQYFRFYIIIIFLTLNSPYLLFKLQILMVLAALPDDKQNQRIEYIMQCQEKLNVRGDVGSGLLIVAKELSLSHAAQQYSNEYHNHRSLLDKYFDAIKELQSIVPVKQWMLENKTQCEWIDHFLRSESSDIQDRGDYLNRRDMGGNIQNTLYEQGQSDSDLNGDMNDSDESDDYLDIDTRTGIVSVRGAGLDVVNGVFTYKKTWDGVPMFAKSCSFKGKDTEFSLFRCELSDKTRRWYISIIPPNNKPGTSKDVDFYYSHSSGNANEVPHGSSWMTSPDNGIDPAPTVEWRSHSVSVSHDDNLIDKRINCEENEFSDAINYDDALMEDETQS